MIHIGTKVTVADNTGARVAQCIGILENSKQKAAKGSHNYTCDTYQ